MEEKVSPCLLGASGGQWWFRSQGGNLTLQATPVEELSLRFQSQTAS